MSEVAALAAPAAAPSAPAVPAQVAIDDPKTAAPAPAPTDGEAKPDPKPADTPESRDNAGRDRRKMSRLYREAAEARAERDLYKRQVEEFRPKPTEDPGAPKLEQFKDIEEYANAKAKFESERTLKEYTAKQHSETQKQMQARLQEGWEEKVARADSKYDDFDEVVGELKPTSPWSMAVMEAENGDDIAHFLGTNLKEAQRIASLPPVSQIREIGKLEAKFLAEPAKPKTPSKAPAPIAALTGTSPAVSDAPSPTDSDKEWFTKRLKAGRGR